MKGKEGIPRGLVVLISAPAAGGGAAAAMVSCSGVAPVKDGRLVLGGCVSVWVWLCGHKKTKVLWVKVFVSGQFT
jgi:hypothetical protein